MRLPNWGQSLNLHSGVPASIKPHLEQPLGLPKLHSQALHSILQTHLSCRGVLFVFTIADTEVSLRKLLLLVFLCAHQLLLSRYKPKLFVFAQHSAPLVEYLEFALSSIQGNGKVVVIFRLLYKGLGRQNGSYVLDVFAQSKECQVTCESLNAGLDSGRNVSWFY